MPISAFWEPLKTQSLLSLSVPLQQLLLGASILSIIVIGTAQYTQKARKKMNNLKIFQRFVQPSEKMLFQIVKNVKLEENWIVNWIKSNKKLQ